MITHDYFKVIQDYFMDSASTQLKLLSLALLSLSLFFHFISKNAHEVEPVVLHTINSMNSTKWVTTFSWIFHFLLIDFQR